MHIHEFFNIELSRTEYYTTGNFICCHTALVSSTLCQAVPSLKKKCSYGGAVGLCWNDNYSTTHIYKYLLMSKLYGEVAAYLPLFYRLLLRDVDCGVELRCHVVTRPPVGHKR